MLLRGAAAAAPACAHGMVSTYLMAVGQSTMLEAQEFSFVSLTSNLEMRARDLNHQKNAYYILNTD